MNDSGYDSNSAIILHRAYGYAPGPNGPVNAGYIDMSIPFSAGALYSTTHDLLRWEQGLFGGKLLSAASLKKMTTPFKENYACGLGVRTVHGHTEIDHGGGIEGFNTELAYYPDDKLTIVVLANLNGDAPESIANQLAAVMHGEKVVLPSERKAITVPAGILEKYVGTYEIAPTFSIAITLEGGQLMAQATNQPKFPLFAESETMFFLKVVDAQVEFFKDDKGNVTHLVLHQGGHDGHRYEEVEKRGFPVRIKKRRGRILFRDPAPSIRFFEDPVRSPNHNFVIAKFFESHKLRGSLSLPFPHSLQELPVCTIRRRPVSRAAPRVSSPILCWPKSTLSLEDCSSVKLNNTRVPYDNCGL